MLSPHGKYAWRYLLAMGLGLSVLHGQGQVLYLQQPWSYSVNYTFGRGTTNPGPPMTGASSDLVYTTDACPLPGQYVVSNKVDCPGLIVPEMKVGGYEIGSTWYLGPGLTNDEPPGYMMLANFNPSSLPQALFQKTVTGLCTGRDYLFWAAIRNLNIPGCWYPNLHFTVETTGGAPIASFPTGNIGGPGDLDNYYPGFYDPTMPPPIPFYGGTFTLPPGVSDVVLKIVIDPSNAYKDCRGALAVDNILLTPMGPNVNISIPGAGGGFVTAACFLGNVPLTLNATIGNSYRKFGTSVDVPSMFVNPAVQWQQSLDQGYTWQDIPGETGLSINHVFHNPDTFYVRVRAADGADFGNLYCNVVSNVIQVQVDSLPDLHFTSNSPVCEDSDVVFDLSGATHYFVSGPNGFLDNTSHPHVYHPSYADSGWYHLHATSYGGCPAEDSTYVVIHGPAVTVSADETICYGDVVQLRATGGGQYAWSPALGLSNPGVAAPTASPPRTTLYTVKVTDGSGCSAFASVTITLRDSLLRAAFAGPAVACPRDIVQFLDSSVGKLASWRWELGDGNVFEGASPPALSYPRVGDYTVRLVVTDSAGCADTASAVLKSVHNCFIAVPGAFSPNGDGANDYLYPLNAYKARDLEFRVFNRQGQAVWETRDWTRKWDGRVNGQLLPPGTFVWTLEYTDPQGRRVALKGTTVLVR